MKETTRFVFLIPFFFLALNAALALDRSNAASSRVRIGVDIRLGYQTCLDSWAPIAEYLSQAIAEHRFVVVPLASRRDVAKSLASGDVDFVVLDPAMEILVNDLYGATPLLTMTESVAGAETPTSTNPDGSGTLILRAGRSDIADIAELRGKRLAAVKPWSLTGWIAQWGLLQKNGIDPQKDLRQVVFLGTDWQVVKSVLDGAADAGAVDTEMLRDLILAKKVPEGSLEFINREGLAVPLELGKNMASTESYPGRVLSKAEATSDELAERVVNALLKQNVETSVAGVPYEVGWTMARNYGRVRQLLQTLMGARYAESLGFPLPRRWPAWVLHALIIGGVLVVFAAALILLQKGYSEREDRFNAQIERLRRELLEARAERQRIDAILTLAGCGIDIVDEQNNIVYADSVLERKYGDWRGRKCHEYYCGSDAPCLDCRRPDPSEKPSRFVVDISDPDPVAVDDPHAGVHSVNGQTTRMIGIPFRDEGGRWLYARVHFPLEACAEQLDA